MTTTQDQDRNGNDRLPGEEAGGPTEIPPRGWWQVMRRAFKESGDDNVPMLAGGVAYFAFLAVFPAIIAAAHALRPGGRPGDRHAAGRGTSPAVLPRQAQPLIADSSSP